jgi:hypothetical protein
MNWDILKKKIISDRAITHEKLPIKAIKESSGLRQKAPCRDNCPFPPLSPLVNKLSKADLPCCSYLNNLRSLTSPLAHLLTSARSLQADALYCPLSIL